MAIEHTAWVLPAAEEAYKHREEILSLWAKIVASLLGKKSYIGITGMPGVGKSVLLEHLTGAAYERNHPAPEQPSPEWEEGKVLGHKKRILLITIPGQQTGSRYEASDRVFESDHPVTGVIHVVANGFAKERSQPAQAALITDQGLKTVEAYNEYQLIQEVEDLKATCQMVIRTMRKHRQPLWMLVVATKCDLYSSHLKMVEGYYSPYGKNDFVYQLRALERQLGSLYFSWDALPVCASLEDFEWNETTVSSTLKPSQRDRLVSNLLRRIEAACAH